jgi:hypothetical protein
MLDHIGLGDLATLNPKTPLSGMQEVTLDALRAAIAAAVTKVAANLPVPVPIAALSLKGWLIVGLAPIT